MGSEDSWSRLNEQQTCANGCGFFGSAATQNLCSKCYRDAKIEEENSVAAQANFAKSRNPPSQALKEMPLTVTVESAVSSAGASASVVSEPVNAVAAETVVKNRCSCCNKRVGLTGFKCRCGHMYCPTHRYPEKHECQFDFKSVGKDAISKANPLVKADKLDSRA